MIHSYEIVNPFNLNTTLCYIFFQMGDSGEPIDSFNVNGQQMGILNGAQPTGNVQVRKLIISIMLAVLNLHDTIFSIM